MNSSTTAPSKYKDWQFWLLFLIVNMSGNLCFTYLLPYKTILIATFCIAISYCLYKHKLRSIDIIYLLIWLTILLLQALYTFDKYSFSSNIHFYIKICIGLSIAVLLKDKFIEYYCTIILIFSIISLVLFAYNCFGRVIPFIPVDSTNLDDGNVFRVSSVIYTQLYNLNSNELTLRNCGPFWEPGAFQGFVNIAITMQLLIYDYIEKDFRWKSKMLIYIVTIITTFSTGGYIVLFLNIMYYIAITKSIRLDLKIALAIIAIIIGMYIFTSIDFLSSKISNDTGRLNFSMADLGNGLHLLLGYGLGAESISQSEIVTVSSIFNLFRYVGVIGFIIFFLPIFHNSFSQPQKVYLFLCIALILMNEPFITAGPFWWSIPLLYNYKSRLYNTSNT